MISNQGRAILKARERLEDACARLEVVSVMFAAADTELDWCRDGMCKIVNDVLFTIKDVDAMLTTIRAAEGETTK